MKISIIAKSAKISDSTKEYALDKLDRLERYFDRIESIHVRLSKVGDMHRCEIEISTAMHHHLSASVEKDSDMTASIDACLDKCERQLKRIKEKLKSHKGAENRKKLGRDVKRQTLRVPKVAEPEQTYEDAKES